MSLRYVPFSEPLLICLKQLFLILHPTPYTLHPTPYTLHPTPYTPHPAPYTLHPTPYTLHPTPYTLHPTPHTLHRTPYTLHPTPLTAPGPRCKPPSPLSSECGTHKTAMARFWPWLELFSGKSLFNVLSCSLLARQRTGQTLVKHWLCQSLLLLVHAVIPQHQRLPRCHSEFFTYPPPNSPCAKNPNSATAIDIVS